MGKLMWSSKLEQEIINKTKTQKNNLKLVS